MLLNILENRLFWADPSLLFKEWRSNLEEIEEKILELKKALYKSWSIDTSSKWTRQNPAKGQCGVTALIVNEMLEGDIAKTKIQGNWHFYNIINGKRYDFTESQFETPIEYDDTLSNQSEAYEYKWKAIYNIKAKSFKKCYISFLVLAIATGK